MDFVDFTKQKLTCALQEIGRLKGSDFPQHHSEECLLEVEKLFLTKLADIDDITPATHQSVRQAQCLSANMLLCRFHTLLGFILRSTNIRNAFEFFDPVLGIAKKLLGPDAKLILSSEWMFSPFTLVQVYTELPTFVFIGLPASESSTALIIPSAGHELGHSVWRTKGLAQQFQPILQAKILDLFTHGWSDFQAAFGLNDITKLSTDISLITYWTSCLRLAARQCEECFCDFLGVRIFGVSYLHAFEYLVAPNLGPSRAPQYPQLSMRTRYMVQAANKVGFPFPGAYVDRFDEADLLPTLPSKDQFLLRISDEAAEAMMPQLIDAAFRFADDAALPLPTMKGQDDIRRSFKITVPASHPSSFADIIGAAWRTFLDADFWDKRFVSTDRRFELLNDLTLKTIEVLEYEARTAGIV